MTTAEPPPRNTKPGERERETALIAAVIAIVVTMVTATSCPTASNPGGEAPVSPSAPESAVRLTLDAGPAGATKTIGGFTVTIPPGALDETITLTADYFPRSADMASVYGIGPFSGGVAFGPAGLRFNVPITIGMEPEIAASEGDQYPFYYYDDGAKAWTEQGACGTANADGIIEFELDHFSTYAPATVSGSGLAIYETTLVATGNADAAYGALKDSVMRGGEIFSMKKKIGADTYGVCGVNFDVMSKLGDSEHQYVELFGEKGTEQTHMNFIDDKMVSNGYQVIVIIHITFHWRKIPLAKYRVEYDFTVDHGDFEDIIRLSDYRLKVILNLEIDENDERPLTYGLDPNYPGAVSVSASASGGSLSSLDPECWIENAFIPASIPVEAAGTVLWSAADSLHRVTAVFTSLDSSFAACDLYAPGFEGEVFRFTMDNFMFAAMDDAVSDTVLIDLIDGNSFVSPGILGPFEIGSDTCAITVTRIP